VPPTRWWNVREWSGYRSTVASGGQPVADREVLGAGEEELETLWLGLRRREGIDVASLRAPQLELAERWRGEGWAAQEGGRLRLTAEGWLRLDALAVALSGA
jgi:oxygen-independent coproporphyrinogen-3 oxidase